MNRSPTFQKEIHYKNNLLLIIVDVSASTGAFVGTICLIAIRRSVSRWTGCRRCGRVGKTPCLNIFKDHPHVTPATGDWRWNINKRGEDATHPGRLITIKCFVLAAASHQCLSSPVNQSIMRVCQSTNVYPVSSPSPWCLSHHWLVSNIRDIVCQMFTLSAASMQGHR